MRLGDALGRAGGARGEEQRRGVLHRHGTSSKRRARPPSASRAGRPRRAVAGDEQREVAELAGDLAEIRPGAAVHDQRGEAGVGDDLAQLRRGGTWRSAAQGPRPAAGRPRSRCAISGLRRQVEADPVAFLRLRWRSSTWASSRRLPREARHRSGVTSLAMMKARSGSSRALRSSIWLRYSTRRLRLWCAVSSSASRILPSSEGTNESSGDQDAAVDRQDLPGGAARTCRMRGRRPRRRRRSVRRGRAGRHPTATSRCGSFS